MKIKHEISTDDAADGAAASAAASRETTVKTVVNQGQQQKHQLQQLHLCQFYFHFNFIFKTIVNS